MRRTVLLTALTLLFAFTVSAAEEPPYTISPASGPAAGGTLITIKGEFSSFWSYGVSFNGVPATSVTVVDAKTLTAITPARRPGISKVLIFEYDINIDAGLTFEFTGEATRERYLLPVFIEPVQGAYGSEFRTELHGLNTNTDESLEIWGLEIGCRYTPPVCNWLEEPMVYLAPAPYTVDLFDYYPFQSGTPGRFIEVPTEMKDDLSLSLRVYDTSRAAENFGTEIPIVRENEFRTKPFALTGVPRDPLFRNTLRLYAETATTVTVRINNETHTVLLRAGEHVFDPAYAQFTAFPTGNGTMHVVITPETNGPAVWGFITVTNNETQHITTITPRQ